MSASGQTASDRAAKRTTLDDLLSPSSIAIVGASDDPARIGGRPVSYLKNLGYDGAIIPINPRRETVQGLTAYPSLDALPDPVDFVLVAVPAPHVADVCRQAAANGAKTVLIFSSGFAEVGENGAGLQQDLVDIAHRTGLRIIGPNCLGAFNSAIRFFPTFTSTVERATPEPGGISIISQSGAYGSHISFVAQRRGLGVRYWLTTGNECDVNVSDVIQLYAEDDDVHTIMAYAESIKNGPRLISALETARANRKPVIFMKVGRSEVGAAAASSHTAALAGEDTVYDAILKQYGAHRARTTEEMLDIADACRPRLYPAGRRIGLVTISGGGGVLMADAASDHGLDVAPMPDDAQAALREIIPFGGPRNPIDVTAQFFNDLTLVPRVMDMILKRGDYDGLVGFWTSVAGSPALAEILITALRESVRGHEDLAFIQSIIAPDEIREQYEAAGFPCFEDPSRAVAAMAALMAFGTAFAEARPDRPALPAPVSIPDGPVDEHTASRILSDIGLPMVRAALATRPEEAGEFAAAMATGAGTFALKIDSRDIAHKTDIGGVRLNVAQADVATVAAEVMETVRTNVPSADIEGVLVSPMAAPGLDCILGAKTDPVFGPIVVFGLGGVFAEVLDDVAIAHAPVSPETAHQMIARLKSVDVLRGARGQPGACLDSLAKAISRLSAFIAANSQTIASVEINPLRAYPDGCLGLDALIVRTVSEGDTETDNEETSDD